MLDYSVLEKYEIDYKKGIARCLDDEEFYEKILTLFLKDEAFAHMKEAYGKKDNAALFSYAHELKGVSANAELTELYNAVCPLVELLRHSADVPRDKVEELFKKLEEVYGRTREGVFISLNG